MALPAIRRRLGVAVSVLAMAPGSGLVLPPARNLPTGAVRHVLAIANDPHYGPRQARYLDSVSLPAAWDVTTGADDLVIAVVDSGVDLDTPDLAGRLVAGIDIVNGDAVPDDDLGHGTNMAGIIAAGTNNGIGIAGATWSGRIMPVKVADPRGRANDADVADGIRWAVDHGADVVNLSLGSPGEDPVLQKAVDYAIARNVVVVAAAGNFGSDAPFYPAACRGVIAVGATDVSGKLARFSNRGRWVDLDAPGVGIVTTAAVPGPGESYTSGSGTSFAAALVSGAAGLIRAAHPAAGPAEVADWLRRSAVDRGALGNDPVYGSGLLHARGALWQASRGPSAASRGSGYWMLSGDGHVYAFGGAAPMHGAAGELARGAAADLEPTPTGAGYWLVDAAGQIIPSGDATILGELGRERLRPGESVTSVAGTPTGRGYWIFTTAGRAFAFGDAPFLADMDGATLSAPVVGSVSTKSGRGYWMVATDGGVFAFGDAGFAGSMGGRPLNAPVRGLVRDPDGVGYWLVAADGGAFAFDAAFRGSMGGTRLNSPVTNMTAYGNGYMMVAADGGAFTFSDKAFHGSLGGSPPAEAIVAVAARS